MSAEVLPEHPISSSSFDSEGDVGDELSTPSGPLSTIKTYDENSSISKLPGTALLRSVHNKHGSNHGSVKSLHSDHTYDFDKTNSAENLDNVDEFGEDLAGSPVATNKKIPAWKLRQQALRSGVPPAPPKASEKKISPLKAASARARATSNNNNNKNVQKTRSGNEDDQGQNWLKKLTTKKETPEEKEKRIKSEALIKKQVPSRWGKDILEEDDEEEESNANETDNKVKGSESYNEEEEDESDTVKKVKSLIEKSFGSALGSAIKKDKEAAEGDEMKEENTADDSPNETEGRGNRWAMMGSAAMTGVRNVQRGLMRGDENEMSDKDTVTEGEKEDELEAIQENGNRRAAMWRNRGAAAFTSVRNAWGGADARRNELYNGDESSAHDDFDSKSVHSDPGQHNHENEHNNKFLSSIGNFLQHTRARFDPELWADPEIQETVAAIEKLREKLNRCRTDHRNTTRRRERQIENSITQQKNFLARKLARQMYGYRSNPFHPCIKEIYEKEILIIVHEVTNLVVDDDSEGGQDGIDELLSSQRFDYDYEAGKEDTDENEATDTLGAFFSKNKEKGSEKKRGDNASVDGSLFSVDGSTIEVGLNSVVPLQTRLIRAQHNEWMTDHQMELVRNFQQKSIEHLYDVIPEVRKEHEQIKAIPQSALEAKIKEMEESNRKLKESYQAHVDAQEKLLAIYRERYVPSVHEDEDDDTHDHNKERGGEGDDTIGSPQSSAKGVPKRPGMWASNLSRSVRGLFSQQNEENEGEIHSVGNHSHDSNGGFNLPSPITTGSQSKNKFLLSFGSPTGSKAASGILANFTAPLPLSKDDDEATDKQSQQDSAKDSAAAAWTVPKMDKASLPESLAEKRAKRAAARRANRPDAPSSLSSESKPSKAAASTSRSELLQRARKAREESAAALGAPNKQPSSPTPSSRSGRSSLRSNTASTRKELSMKDLMVAAGDSRRKLMENDSRMERLAQKKDHLSKNSPLSPTPSVTSTRAGSRISERLRIVGELNDGLNRSSHHSLHERKPRARSLKSVPQLEDEEDGDEPLHESSLHDVDEFGGEAQ